jgi:hypothetical protein
MLVTDRQNARRDGCGQRLTIAGRGQSRGGARRRARPMVGGADQDRVEQPPFVRRR